jgi:hypothetical protein
MTDSDRRALTDLATNNLSSWRALWLRKRLARDPELASEWEETQALFQRLRQESLPEIVPETPKWPAPQHAPKESFAVFKKPVALIAAGFAAFLGLTFASVLQTKRAQDKKQIQHELEVMNQLKERSVWLYDPNAIPAPTPPNLETKSREVNDVGIVGDTNVALRTTWRAFGDLRVTATYADGSSKRLVSSAPEDPRLVSWLKRYRPNYPEAKGGAIVSWSRGKANGGRLFRSRLVLPAERTSDSALVEDEHYLTTYDWLELEDAGRFEGFGTHQIKGKDGKVLVTLLVEPLSVQSRHDSESSQRRAKDPVRP